MVILPLEKVIIRSKSSVFLSVPLFAGDVSVISSRVSPLSRFVRQTSLTVRSLPSTPHTPLYSTRSGTSSSVR